MGWDGMDGTVDSEQPDYKSTARAVLKTARKQKMNRVSPQRCFPLNKGEEWLKPDYSQEPKVVFAKTTAKVNRYFTNLMVPTKICISH